MVQWQDLRLPREGPGFDSRLTQPFFFLFFCFSVLVSSSSILIHRSHTKKKFLLLISYFILKRKKLLLCHPPSIIYLRFLVLESMDGMSSPCKKRWNPCNVSGANALVVITRSLGSILSGTNAMNLSWMNSNDRWKSHPSSYSGKHAEMSCPSTSIFSRKRSTWVKIKPIFEFWSLGYDSTCSNSSRDSCMRDVESSSSRQRLYSGNATRKSTPLISSHE